MRKPGTNEDDVQMSDVLCDFCHQEWTLARPMVEGHQGSCICGPCLTLAYVAVVLNPPADSPPGPCTMCLENRPAPLWHYPQPPAGSAAHACVRCIKQAAAILSKDPDFNWTKPTR